MKFNSTKQLDANSEMQTKETQAENLWARIFSQLCRSLSSFRRGLFEATPSSSSLNVSLQSKDLIPYEFSSHSSANQESVTAHSLKH